MNIAKLVFDAIDIAFDKKQNREFVIDKSINIKIEKDIVYSDINPDICKLDCYYVPQEGPYPVIVNIHGGGFMAGDKEYRRTLCAWFAEYGLFTVNVNYGLSPKCTFPTPIIHLVEALNWVADNAERLNLDLGRIAVCGDSAGAYYASMLAAITTNNHMQEVLGVMPKATFKAAILNCGLYDIEKSLHRRMLLRLNKKIFTSYTGIKANDLNEYKYKDICSPLPYISEDFPSTFIVYAKKDIFCGGQAEYMLKALETHDIYYESYHSISHKRNHCFSLEWTSKEAQETNALIKDFLIKMIKGTLPRRQSESDILVRACEQIS